jgi:hypothetical protein
MAYLGATDRDLAAAFQTTITNIERWKWKHPAFGGALKLGKKKLMSAWSARFISVVKDVIRGRRFDVAHKFLPNGLSLADAFTTLSADEKRFARL